MDKITIIGLLASICTATSLLPQLVKIIKEKKAEGVSIGMLAILFAGLGLWVWYGICKEDWIIIASNTVSLAINLTIAIFMFRYQVNDAKQ